MFGRRCESCGAELKANWRFCPSCGARVGRPRPDIFEEVERAFEEFDKMFSPRFFRFPRIKFPTRGGGVSITIRSGLGREPEVRVSTFGDYKRFEPEIKRRLGLKPPLEEVEEKPRVPKVTEEPEMTVERVDDRQVLRLKLPGIRSVGDVDVRKLEQSIEIRAFADDKAYFKLIPVKPETQVLRKDLKDETLEIEIG
jgi:HSP20 family molecular chaperone IbpA